MEGRVFDAQVVLSPKDSPLGKVLSQYVCVRVVRMDDVDIGLFDRDWNNAIYFFVLNADEQIYMRYGGRESQSPDTYNSLDSLRIALEQGLVLHQKYLQGKPAETGAPETAVPARNAAVGRTHLRAAAMRRVPSDRRFPEYPARARRRAGQTDATSTAHPISRRSGSRSTCRRVSS